MKSGKPKTARHGFRLRRGLFTKYLSLTVSFLLVIIILISGVQMIFSMQYFREEKEGSLFQLANSAAQLTRTDYKSTGGQYLQANVLSQSFALLAAPYNGMLFLVDLQGQTLLCTEGTACTHTAYHVSDQIIESCIRKGSYAETGFLGGIYSSREVTVGVPVELDGENVCLIFVSASAASLDQYMAELATVFIVVALSVFVIAALVMYFVTRSMTMPLVHMADATEQFSRGDFTMRINVEGDDEIAQLGRAFNEMASALAALENSRRSFVANVSHELKTPMTTIGGFIDGILDGTIPPERQAHYLRIVRDEISRLSRMVRSMLSLSRLDAGDMVIKPADFDIRDILVQTVFSFEQAIDAKNVEIRGLDGGKAMVRADRDLFHQVVYNLVDNAVKFVDKGGYIDFRINPEGAYTRVSIRNSGPGIPRTELNSVFDRFYKTDRSRSLDKSGVGLGLYIVKSVVTLHGGSISVDSREGEFTEFVFTVPTGSPPASQNPSGQQ